MLLIFGFRARSSTQDTGTFFCPREGGDRTYERKMAKRWFSVFWIPIIPLNDLGEFIECTSCNSTYDPAVLESKTASEMEDLQTTAIRHVIAAMVHADGVIADQERTTALKVAAQFASRPYGADDLAHDLVSLDREHLRDHLQELGAVLNAHGREAVLTAAVDLAAADGDLDGRELGTLYEIGDALTMSHAHIEGVISTESARLGITR